MTKPATKPRANDIERSVTTGWLEVADLRPLEGAEGTAERLLLLLHYGIDWQHGWVGRYTGTYWDQVLPDRVLVASFLCGGDLRRWWNQISVEMRAEPRNARERRELDQLLSFADPMSVVRTLRGKTAPLVLRVRIVADAVRAQRLGTPA